MVEDIFEKKNLDFSVVAKELSDDEKAVLQGRAEGLTHKQISDDIDIPISRVRSIEAFVVRKLTTKYGISLDNIKGSMKESLELLEKFAKVSKKTDDGDGMDPVGKGDADIDNDGDVDSSDKYLKMRRKAIGKAIKNVKESYDLEELTKKTVKSYMRNSLKQDRAKDRKSGMQTAYNKAYEQRPTHKARVSATESYDLDEAKDVSDHMKNPYHKTLDAHDYKHVKSQVVDQGIARHSPYTAHTYNRDGGHIAQVWSYHNGNKPVWHARYKQDNGIMAPAFGETKPSLSKYLERRFGSTNE
jgi:hypothetical protein